MCLIQTNMICQLSLNQTKFKGYREDTLLQNFQHSHNYFTFAIYYSSNMLSINIPYVFFSWIISSCSLDFVSLKHAFSCLLHSTYGSLNNHKKQSICCYVWFSLTSIFVCWDIFPSQIFVYFSYFILLLFM